MSTDEKLEAYLSNQEIRKVIERNCRDIARAFGIDPDQKLSDYESTTFSGKENLDTPRENKN